MTFQLIHRIHGNILEVFFFAFFFFLIKMRRAGCTSLGSQKCISHLFSAFKEGGYLDDIRYFLNQRARKLNAFTG